jgi:hypothetical protein
MLEKRPNTPGTRNVVSLDEYRKQKEKKPVVVPLFTGYLKRVK